MKMLWMSLSLILAFAQLPFGPTMTEKPAEEKTPVKGWWMVSHFGVPPTQYARTGKGVIRARSVGSLSSLFKDIEEKKRNSPVLSWRWKISNVVCSAIETRKDRFDSAARVIVIFGKGKSIRRVGGGEPSGVKIEYIWASHLPKGHIFDHPEGGSCKVFILESGNKRAGQWVDEERNIHKDFKTAFGMEPNGVLAIGIQTDTKHSNEMVTAYYSEPFLKRK